MKKTIFALVLLLLINSASGAELVIPQQIPAGTAWSFSVSLDSSNAFTEARVLIDGKEKVKVFPSMPQPAVSSGEIISAFVVDTDPNGPSGLVLFVSHIGFSSGTHSVKVTTMNNADVVNERESNVSVVDVLSSDFKGTFEEKISQTEAKIGSLETRVDEKISSQLSTAMQDLEKKLSDKIDESSKQNSGMVDNLRNDLDRGLATIRDQNAATTSMMQQFSAMQEEKRQQELADAAEAEKAKSNPLGFFSLGNFSGMVSGLSNNGLLIGLLIVVVAVVLLFSLRSWFHSERKVSLPPLDSAFGEESEEPVKRIKPQATLNPKVVRDEEDGIIKLKSSGKWALGKEEKKKEIIEA